MRNWVKCYKDIVESLYNGMWSIGIDCVITGKGVH